MPTLAMVGLLLLTSTVAHHRSRNREHIWSVLSKAGLDTRVHRQLEQLAAQDQALIRFFTNAAEAKRVALQPGSISVELREEKSLESFLATLRREAGETAVEPTAEIAKEGYILEATYPRASVPNHLRITAATPQGFHDALLRVPELLIVSPPNLPTDLIPRPQAVRVEKDDTSAVIADFPSFPERGVVEGFYGVPWTHQDRIDILRFEGAHDMNVYYYAPKNDPYHRKLWREPYPPEDLKRLSELVEAARRNFVDFCFAISPGLTMAYSSEQDFQALANKLATVGKLGVSCFALFLDDVPQDMQDAQDKSQFKTLAQAHVHLTNKLYRRLKELSPQNRLTLTPTTYTNEWGSRDYIRELGVGIDPSVQIVWTGPKVFSPTITVEQAREWGEYIHREPLVWDNFPVNDGTPWCRYLGPLTGRDPHLPSAVRGLLSNPMNQAQASMIPLQTVADYLWNAQAYDQDRSETHAVIRQFGKDAPRALAPFLKTYGTYAWDDGIFTPLFSERRQPMDVAAMQSRLTNMKSQIERLGNQKRYERLLAEISPAVKRTSARLAEVKAGPAFRPLPDGKLQWNESYNALSAYHLARPPNLDGDFAKWQSGPLYVLAQAAQVAVGAKLWKGSKELSARVALAWDESYFYVGVDVTDPDLYQPFFARGIQNGDTFVLMLETAFRKNFYAKEPTGDEYELFFSPGDFASVRASIFSDEDYLPARARPHDYMQEIRTAWRKTPHGYSGDIAVPAFYFEGGKLAPGYELGLSFGVRKVTRPTRPTDEENLKRIELQSKKDHLFRVSTRNPSTFPRLVLAEAKP
jgi:hypothetical protein